MSAKDPPNLRRWVGWGVKLKVIVKCMLKESYSTQYLLLSWSSSYFMSYCDVFVVNGHDHSIEI